MADASATGETAASGERRAAATDQPLPPTPTPETTPSVLVDSAAIQRQRQRAGTTVLEDDGGEENDDNDESDEAGGAVSVQRPQERSVAMTTNTDGARSTPAMGRAPLPSLVTRSTRTLDTAGIANSPTVPPSAESRNQRISSAGDTGHEWGVDRDEGWMPKPARLHSGKTRSCAVCFAPLQYTTTMQSWDEYVQSSEYLEQLQRNLLSDAFISSLICGESTGGGDLPTEHRMHKNRKTKCRQSVHDYVNMTSAGVIDQAHKEKTSVRILEEMLLYGLSTPLYASVLERRLAVISHSTGIARILMHQSHMQRLPREVAAPASNVELHHLAIQTLSALLQSFDYSSNAAALQAFEEMTRLLTCFPALSLYSFWSPAPRFPETPLSLSRSMVEASSSVTTPRVLGAEFAVDGLDTSFWQSQPRPGVTYFSIRHPDLSRVSSIQVRWHLKCFPKTMGVQYRLSGEEQFEQLTEQAAAATSGPERFEVRFPSECEEVRLVMSGMPMTNRSACYAIEDVKLNVPITNSLFVDPKTTLHDICAWLVRAISHDNEDVVVEAIGALRAWTMATASLSSVLAFVNMLLQVKALYQAGSQPGVARFAVGQAQTLVRGIQAHRLDESDRIVKGVGRKSTIESRKIRALFEPSCCSAGVTIEDGGMAVRTRETSYQYAAVNAGIASGRASWKFRLDNDTVDDEMTCFGAAILPVTVSGYDSSPNLWMLRGYNGNLYARGHKLNRTIGKVHPGDTVQIDVDMNEGTLAYKINDNEYGAVFTDLAGHEVYPAVSFYGSGKVITLLGVEKWDDADAGSLSIDPIYLSNLKEYHYSVGYGTFGKGTQLGYASDNADVRASAGSAPAASGVIRVCGENKQRSLSTHPPARGDAFVMYDLGHAYSTFAGAVAINDDVQTDSLQQRAVAVTFSILGDGVVLWTSKSLARVRVTESFEVDVANVRILQLRATCTGSNQCAHAIWVDPHLIPLDEWECVECHVMNKGVATACTLCRTKPTGVDGDRLTDGTAVAPISMIQRADDYQGEDSSIDDMVNAILAEVLELARMDRSVSARIRFEQPFCRQPSQDVLLQLLRMISNQGGEFTDSETKHRRSLHVLGLLEANLSSIASYDVSPQELGIQDEAIDEVKCTLEELARVLDKAGNKSTNSELESAAARALIAGTPILYTPAEKVKLLLELLRGNREMPYPSQSAKRHVLSSMLKVLSLPGRDGILNFLPSTSRQQQTSVDRDEEECTSVSVDDIAEVVSLLIATACYADSSLEGNKDDRDQHQQSAGDDTTIAEASMRLLQSYQLLLLAEALQVTSQKPTSRGSGQPAVRAYIQEATVRFSSLLLRYSGNTIAVLIEQHAEEALFTDTPQEASAKLRARTFQLPILSKLLPWLVACLCLLRRQSSLAISILPSLVKFSSIMDQFCSELSTVKASESRLRRLERFMKARHYESQELERMLATDAALATHHQASKPMYNVFKQLYTGDKDHFEGQIGFQFEASSTFTIIALGRSVNPVKNGGQLVRQHTIRLWEESTQSLIAQATVGATSRKDAMGYAYEPLASPARLTQGKLYRLTTQEFANGGDPWYKKENLPDEEYDASYIKILRDCYASGSTGFPNSQNLSGAAYGVPTFLVEGENPLKKMPRFLLPFGATSLKLSAKRKSPGNTISHSGTSAHVMDGGTDLWRTCFLQTAAYCGHHAADFVVKCGKAGGIAAGHVCIGADWSPAGAKTVANMHGFLGASETSIGWMPSIGSIWVMGKRISYGHRKHVLAGDILTIAIDYDHELISFAHNGVELGVAIGPPAYAPKYSLSSGLLPSQLLMGISLNGTLDVVHVRPAGVGGSTLRLHWLLDLHNSVASLAGRVCGTLIAGNPVDEVEEELLPWLQSPLLSGGVSSQMTGGREELPEWTIALQEEDARWKEATPDSSTMAAGGPVQPERPFDRRQAGSARFAKRSSFFDDDGLEENIFINDLIQDMGEGGASATIIAWLEKVAPDRSFLSRLGKFPLCERPMCAALIKHSPAHLLHEVQAIISSSKTLDGRSSVDHIDLVPSDDLTLIWKRLIMLRHWLIKTRQEYRARAANDELTVNSSEPKATSDRSLPTSGQDLLEMKITVAQSFDELVSQIHERASFLCILNPASEERDRMKVESQQALSNLADKWSAQKTPPSLEPMLERWRSLRESDSSKWSGIVDVLRAQHRWRRRRASVHIASSRPLPEGSPIPVEDEDEEEDESESVEDNKNAKYRDTFAAMLRACDLYIRNGVGAPPEILRALLDRRQRRSECRVFGLDAMKTLLTSLSMDSTRHNALMFLRPAFRGFSEDEKESRDMNDGQVIAETFRATVRHHYLKGLEGCSRRTAQRVQLSFWNLYTMLAGLLASGEAQTVDTALKQAIICAWCLDFESRDHSFLLKSGLLTTLQNEFSMGAILQRAHQEMNELLLLQDATLAQPRYQVHDDINWHPLSDEFVQRNALSCGLITKRDIMLMVLRAPRYACSTKWWKENALVVPDEGPSATGGGASIARHTVSSLSLRYSELLNNLQTKLAWSHEHTLGRKVLQFGLHSCGLTSSSHGVGLQSPGKHDLVSYAEVPALGEVANFTLEMWIYPTELGGYRVLRADNGFQTGSVYVELVDRFMHVAINGNHPREQLFNMSPLQTHTWTHISIVYRAAALSIDYYVNGVHVECKNFTRVNRAIVFRESRIGCWIGDAAGDASAILNAGPQRVFKGSIAEIRLWRVSRTAYQIYRDFQRAIPGDIEPMHPGPPNTGADARNATSLLGMWHLDEGEGVCGNNRVEVTGTTPAQRIMETAGCNASLIACHWAHANVPVWSGANVDLLDNGRWQDVVSRIRSFQRLARRRLAKQIETMVHYARTINRREEDALMSVWVDDDDQDAEDVYEGSEPSLGGQSLASQHALEKALSVSTDDVLLHDKHVQRCAWIVFRFLAHVSICGTQERSDSEATNVAAAAKLRRKQRIHVDGASSNVSSPLAAAARTKATFEEDDVAKTAELASDAAKTAASNRQLEEPVLQMLWFSNEVHRKIFEVLENELSYATVMIQTTEGLTRAQRMVRSSSTPVKDREIAIRPQQSVVVGSARSGAAASSRGVGSAFLTGRSDTVVLEPLEVERHVFAILRFVLSQSTSQVALNHLSRPRVLRELLQLLRLGSPRSQRIVKLILRRICASGVVGPKDVAEIWGSESVLVDLLLDQVAESVCSTAAPMPTLGLSVTAASAAAAASSTATTVSGNAETVAVSVAPITESLSNPVGFRSGQVYLAAASESVALLRLLMTDPRWGDIVADLLSAAVRNVTPILARRRSQGTGIGDQHPAASDIRSRTAIIRAVGALCVLGSHTDCLRVGGKVEVTAAKATRGSDGKTMVDYGFNFSNDAAAAGARPTLATLIELDGRASTARVVFDGSDESDPSHNVQEVNLATVSPVEEVHLSGKAAPLSADMMPVILKLASLDESEVISSFDELWQMQIRSRALLAFESMLRHTANAAELLHVSEEAVMPTSLLEAALQPVSLSTFVSVPFLQERGRMILCRLIEASTPFGEPMFRGLPEPTPFQAEPPSNESESVVESSDDPVEEETEAYRVRRGFASTLAAMGFEFDLCMAALEHSRNDPNAAVEWLMGTGAIEYQERQETRRLAEATLASRRAALNKSGDSCDQGEMTLDAKAKELAGISGMPYRLALCALELANADPNHAMEWLMEHGSRYAGKSDRLLLLTDAIRVESSLSLTDAAALDGIDHDDPLVASASHEATIDAAPSSSSSSRATQPDPSTVDTTNIMAVTLAPILARLPNKPAPATKPKRKNAKQDSEGVTGGFAALDPEYLTPYVLLTVSDEIGPVQRLSATGRTGVFRSYCPRDGVLITFLNTETGAYEDEWYAPTDVRRVTQIYDEPLDGVASIHRVALRTERALSTHYARRGVTALLRSWGQGAATTALRGLSETVLAAVGGPRQFVNLLKLVAASEMVFSRKSSSLDKLKRNKFSFSTGGAALAGPMGKPAHDESASILHDLQVIALQILREEAASGRLAESTTGRMFRSETKHTSRTDSPLVSGTSPAQRAVERELESSLLESNSGFAAPQAVGFEDGTEEDGDLYRAIALSMQDATASGPAVDAEAEEECNEDDDQFIEQLHSAHPRALRVRQPSYTEAQEVASAYLGGTVDDHDGLLSSVLVKECVSHFVESTRIAGAGTGTASASIMEFQSLHPYYGRCEYVRAVVLDKSHRCVRVKFDKRCMFGAKAKLTFYSDAKCEKVIAVIDASSVSPPGRTTTSGISDLLIQSHQFWFKFCASEDDVTKNYGYGFRFQVQPVQSISWASECDVQTTASLEWACWVLEFLLNEATGLVAHGAVHNRQIYGALVRYLRSSGVPFKSRVVRLLVQLLHQPERFPLAEMPDLEPLEGISKLAIAQAKAEKAAGKLFIQAELLQLVELSISTRRAAAVFKQARSPLTIRQQPPPSLVLPAPWGTREMPDLLSDLDAVASFLLGKTDVLPPHILLAIWLDVYGSVAIIETDHPYSSSSTLGGTIHFPHAQSLQVTFDSRCATAAGTELKLRVVHDGPAASPAHRTGAFAFSGTEQWPSAAIDLSGTSQISYSFDGGENPDARFGVSVCISAMGLSTDQQLARVSHDQLAALQSLMLKQRDASTASSYWTTTMDGQLVDWVNNTVENSGAGNSNTNASSNSSAIVAVDLKTCDIRLDRTRDALRCTQLLEMSLTQLHVRFALLKHFNQCLKHTLPLLDLRDTASPWTMAYTLRQLGHCVFFDLKNGLVEAAIEATSTPADTNSSTSTARITLDRLQALESRDDREVEPSVSECFFAQAFRQLHHVDPATFRRKIDNKGRLFSVKFHGEEGVDWGGVYREGVNSMVDDLFSPHFNLFVLCPNGQHDTGTNRAMYLPNPKCTSPVAIQMFEFVGKLLGISLRTRGDFPFAFPSLVWKQLIGEPLGRHDLDGTDAMFVQMLDGIQHCARDGILTEAEFDAAFDGLDLKFTAFDCNGQEVELIERGKHTRVTYGNRLEYCQLAERYRLQESATQIAAMARGLATVFPRRVLTLLTAHEMELLTCGSPKIDIALWQQHTRYDGYNENDPTVALFWEAMASFSDAQRSDFVRFAWGRSRLPRGKWPQPFKLTKKGGRDSTLSLPVAHTCFFSVELPPYTTLDKMTTMLLATINFGLGGILMA